MLSVSLHLGQRRQVSSSSPSPPFQMPFIHQICDISFIHWRSCFPGKQESKTVVLIISRILKEKKRNPFPNSVHLVIVKVSETAKESLLYISFQPRNLVPQSRMEALPPILQGQNLNHWPTRVFLMQKISRQNKNPANTSYPPNETYVSPYTPPTSSGFPFGFLTHTCLQGMCPRTIASHGDLSDCQSRGEQT